MQGYGAWLPDQPVKLSPLAPITDPGEGHNLSKSAVRALDVLEILALSARPLRAIEIQRQLGTSQSSTDQLLKTMVDGAYLVFNPRSKRYFPSPRLAFFGKWIADTYFGGSTLHDLMSSVWERTGEAVTLSTSQGEFMQIIDVLQGPSAPRTTRGRSPELWKMPKGLRAPIFGSATGSAWLASQDDEEIRACIARCRRQLGSQADRTDEILRFIQEVRKRGYALGTAENDILSTVSFPLPSEDRDIVLILSVAGLSGRIRKKQKKIVSVLREDIARYLG